MNFVPWCTFNSSSQNEHVFKHQVIIAVLGVTHLKSNAFQNPMTFCCSIVVKVLLLVLLVKFNLLYVQ